MNASKPSPSFNIDTWFGSDEQFQHLYPASIQALSRRHWTPLSIARKAADFLAAAPGSRILDIGGGVGKFCLAAGYYQPDSTFFGVEQRKSLVKHANGAKDILGLKNVSFIQGNFTQLDLTDYDHFYFFNSFYENIAGTEKIDDSIAYSTALYNYYYRYLYKQLEKMPAGTRLATYHTLEDELPHGFEMVSSEIQNLLKFWIKL